MPATASLINEQTNTNTNNDCDQGEANRFKDLPLHNFKKNVDLKTKMSTHFDIWLEVERS